MKLSAGLVFATLLTFGALWAMQLDQEAETDLIMEQAESALAKPYVCPPCGMGMPLDSITQSIDGLSFAICNPRCGEIVAADPTKYLAQAIPAEPGPEGK